jgi:CopG family transcriptional regulator / antitoxin EndoAI
MYHKRRLIMHTETVRLNVTLPRDLVESLNSIAGPRSRSRFISESIREYIRLKKQADLEKQLEEGYRALAKENIALAREFEVVDLEGWHEY